MSDFRHVSLNAKLVVCSHTIKSLLRQIKEIEVDAQLSANEKLSKIKMIRDELSKVGMEIDTVKKEITLLNTYNVN
jgi:hypothetical protein